MFAARCIAVPISLPGWPLARRPRPVTRRSAMPADRDRLIDLLCRVELTLDDLSMIRSKLVELLGGPFADLSGSGQGAWTLPSTINLNDGSWLTIDQAAHVRHCRRKPIERRLAALGVKLGG